jgi:hypothetical protein
MEEISKDEILDLEKLIIDNAGVETLNNIKRRAADLRAEHIENAFVPIREQMSDLNRSTNELQANLSRDEWDAQNRAADKVHDQESYESYLKERQILIDTRAAIEREQIEKAITVPDTPTGKKLAQMAKNLADREGMSFDAAWFRVKAEHPDLENKLLIEINEGMK